MPEQLSYDFPAWMVRQRTWPGGKRLGKRPRNKPIATGGHVPAWPGHDWRNGPRQPVSGADVVQQAANRLKLRQAIIARNAAALTRNPAREEQQNPYVAPPIAPHLTVFGARADEAERWRSYKGEEKPKVDRHVDRVRNLLVEGNLPLNDYRYWVGVPWALSLRSVCRACGLVAYTHEERLAHRDGPKQCAVLLTRVYNKLRKDAQRQCVICEEQPCSSLYYGVPLHPMCRRAWMWKEPTGIDILGFEIKAMQREIAREDAEYKEKQKQWADKAATSSPTVTGA